MIIPTFVLSFVIKFVSKKQAKENGELNISNSGWNEAHKKEIDEYNKILNKKIIENNASIDVALKYLTNKYLLLKEQKINYNDPTTDGWINLKESSIFGNPELDETKGVYIIKNASKNKYYVGQSKNMGKRLFQQHFRNGEPKNIIFAKDWYNGDTFQYKFITAETKDELDALEKKYIAMYDSFYNGYNKTGGNK